MWVWVWVWVCVCVSQLRSLSEDRELSGMMSRGGPLASISEVPNGTNGGTANGNGYEHMNGTNGKNGDMGE